MTSREEAEAEALSITAAAEPPQIITNQRTLTGQCCSKWAYTWSTSQGTICRRKMVFFSCRIIPAVDWALNSHYMMSPMVAWPPSHPRACVLHRAPGNPQLAHGCLVLPERVQSAASSFTYLSCIRGPSAGHDLLAGKAEGCGKCQEKYRLHRLQHGAICWPLPR